MKRKRSKTVRSFSSGRASPYRMALTKLPRPQERVPRSFRRPLMTARRAGMTTVFPARQFLQLQVRRKPVLSVTPRTSQSGVRFVFRSPFARQYAAMKSVGAAVRRPSRVAFCLARRVRREVLFAFRRAGYSGSARKKRWNRNGNSLHRC